jgi:hypothetical protein
MARRRIWWVCIEPTFLVIVLGLLFVLIVPRLPSFFR